MKGSWRSGARHCEMSMNPCDIIRKKRFGEELNELEIRAFVNGVVDGSFADYQASALLMAISARCSPLALILVS